MLILEQETLIFLLIELELVNLELKEQLIKRNNLIQEWNKDFKVSKAIKLL